VRNLVKLAADGFDVESRCDLQPKTTADTTQRSLGSKQTNKQQKNICTLLFPSLPPRGKEKNLNANRAGEIAECDLTDPHVVIESMVQPAFPQCQPNQDDVDCAAARMITHSAAITSAQTRFSHQKKRPTHNRSLTQNSSHVLFGAPHL
jgi:hypothetical protein